MGNYYDYDRITSIVLPATITKIGSGAFSGLSNVRSITIKGALTEISYDSFAGCINLTSITLPSSLKKLGAWAFEACKSHKTITIPSGVTALPNYVFSDCTSLATINIPSALKNFGINAFSGTAWLKARQAKYSSHLVIVNGVLVDAATTTLKSVTIPSDVTALAPQAFEKNTNVTSVVIPNGVTKIGIYCFSECTNLTSISVPTTETSFGGRAFNKTPWLTAGVYAAKTQSALILADQSLVMETKQFLIKKCPMLITAIGGAGAVPNDILDKMVAVVKSGW